MKLSILAVISALAMALLPATGCNQQKQPEAAILQDKFDAYYSHAAAIDEDGTLWTWGANNYGQLGNGTQTNQAEPVAVAEDVIGVKACSISTIIWKKDGSVWACGQVPLCDEPVLTPVPLQLDFDELKGLQITDIAIQSFDSYLCDQSHNLWHIHDNTVDLLMENVASVDCFSGNAAILQTDGTLWISSLNLYGEAGDGTTNEYYEPVRVMTDVSMVSGGPHCVCALKKDGTVWFWGENLDAAGNRNNTGKILRVPVKVMEDVCSVSATSTAILALKNDGSLWGRGTSSVVNGYVEDGKATVLFEEPVKVMDDVAYCATFTGGSIAVKKDGTVWSWGWNKLGLLGYEGGTLLLDDGSYVQETPKQITGLKVAVPEQ